MNTAPRTPPQIAFGPRLKRSPFFEATERWGVAAWTVYNHWLMPAHFGDPMAEYRALTEAVTLWDVSAQRQVEIAGPDARAFLQYLSPRNLASVEPGQCRYVLMTAADGGVVNDPVMICLAEDRFWLSAADSDVLLWARGIASTGTWEMTIREADVAPLQLQGPRAPAVLEALGLPGIGELRYFRWQWAEIAGADVLVSRTGWSGERGYEIYLQDSAKADDLWEALMAAGEPHGIVPAAPNQIRRIEGALLSYGADMDLTVNPWELGLEWTVDLDQPANFIGKAALRRLAAGLPGTLTRRLVGVEIDGPPVATLERWWQVEDAGGQRKGYVTSACYSPRLEANIGLALIAVAPVENGDALFVRVERESRPIQIRPLPFIPSRAGDAATGSNFRADSVRVRRPA